MSVLNCVLMFLQTYNWAPFSTAKTDICQFICIRAFFVFTLLSPLYLLQRSSSAASSSAVTLLHSIRAKQNEELSDHETPTHATPWCELCHMWLPLFIKLTQARLRSRPLPALVPAHYSQYLHAILNCWEFPWWWEPPLHEIFRAHGDSREARRRVFTPIWLYDMIFSWAMTVLLN